MIKIVTGYQGRPHLEAAEQGLFNAGVCGEKVVLRTNRHFAYRIISNNLISIGSGDLINQGRHITVPYNSTEEVVIENGRDGYNRIDAIVVKYLKNSETGIETAQFAVVKGVAVPEGDTPPAPVLAQGNIFAGDNEDDFLLYYVHLNGLSIDNVSVEFSLLSSNMQITDILDLLTSVMTCSVDESYIIKNNAVNEKLPLEYFSKSNTLETLIPYNGSVKIGRGVSKIIVSAQVEFYPIRAGNKTIRIFKNQTQIAFTHVQSPSNYHETLNITPIYVNVEEGDIITVYVYGDKGDEIANIQSHSYMTIQAIG